MADDLEKRVVQLLPRCSQGLIPRWVTNAAILWLGWEWLASNVNPEVQMTQLSLFLNQATQLRIHFYSPHMTTKGTPPWRTQFMDTTPWNVRKVKRVKVKRWDLPLRCLLSWDKCLTARLQLQRKIQMIKSNRTAAVTWQDKMEN